MKLVKNFAFAVVLMFAIAFNTPAGEQATPGFVPPPPPRVTATSDEYTAISNTEETGGIATKTSDYLLLKALVALLSVY
jgi:hypothetical protein